MAKKIVTGLLFGLVMMLIFLGLFVYVLTQNLLARGLSLLIAAVLAGLMVGTIFFTIRYIIDVMKKKDTDEEQLDEQRIAKMFSGASTSTTQTFHTVAAQMAEEEEEAHRKELERIEQENRAGRSAASEDAKRMAELALQKKHEEAEAARRLAELEAKVERVEQAEAEAKKRAEEAVEEDDCKLALAEVDALHRAWEEALAALRKEEDKHADLIKKAEQRLSTQQQAEILRKTKAIELEREKAEAAGRRQAAQAGTSTFAATADKPQPGTQSTSSSAALYPPAGAGGKANIWQQMHTPQGRTAGAPAAQAKPVTPYSTAAAGKKEEKVPQSTNVSAQYNPTAVRATVNTVPPQPGTASDAAVQADAHTHAHSTAAQQTAAARAFGGNQPAAAAFGTSAPLTAAPSAAATGQNTAVKQPYIQPSTPAQTTAPSPQVSWQQAPVQTPSPSLQVQAQPATTKKPALHTPPVRSVQPVHQYPSYTQLGNILDMQTNTPPIVSRPNPQNAVAQRPAAAAPPAIELPASAPKITGGPPQNPLPVRTAPSYNAPQPPAPQQAQQRPTMPVSARNYGAHQKLPTPLPWQNALPKTQTQQRQPLAARRMQNMAGNNRPGPTQPAAAQAHRQPEEPGQPAEPSHPAPLAAQPHAVARQDTISSVPGAALANRYIPRAQGAPAETTGTATEEAAAKRRGRPPKPKTEEELNKPKRPRGRPPKPKTEEELNKPKRPRGRPPKPKTEEELNKPKRPRGRPRKNPLPEEQAQE